jgi:hypothetical protein
VNVEDAFEAGTNNVLMLYDGQMNIEHTRRAHGVARQAQHKARREVLAPEPHRVGGRPPYEQHTDSEGEGD